MENFNDYSVYRLGNDCDLQNFRNHNIIIMLRSPVLIKADNFFYRLTENI